MVTCFQDDLRYKGSVSRRTGPSDGAKWHRRPDLGLDDFPIEQREGGSESRAWGWVLRPNQVSAAPAVAAVD